jgi:lipopolysaccharide/colanic/teichoic acid biosynthesis glycosyltransferase
MCQWSPLFIELALIAFATLYAAVLRDNLQISVERLSALEPYLLLTLAVAVVVLPVLGTNRAVWRFSTIVDYLRILVATIAIVAGALGLLMVLSPVILCVAILIAVDVGLPVVFWRQRPGLNGRPFKLYKFRTMAAANKANGERTPDDRRTSDIGRFLRLTRLVVRPGLTGWAQVKGGREISPADKAALDVRCARNASLAFDLEIIARTIKMVLLGEAVDAIAIRRAWRELQQAGICASPESGGGVVRQGSLPHERRDRGVVRRSLAGCGGRATILDCSGRAPHAKSHQNP